MQEFEVDLAEALDRYLKLTAIPGDSGNEKGVAEAIVAILREAGVAEDQIQYDDAASHSRIGGQCGNLIVTLAGNGQDGLSRTLLSAHMDTVPICIGSQPVAEGGFVTSQAQTGLGADDRSGCAAILTAAVERLRRGDQNFAPAVLVFTVQEEIGLVGARHLDVTKVGAVDQAFNFDGGSVEKVTTGAIGGERMDVTLLGSPSHAGVAPEKGISAIVIAAKAIADLESRGWHGRIENGFGAGTANVGVIAGGDATNVVTPQVSIRAEARSYDSAMRTQIVAEIKAAFDAAASSVTNDAGQCGRCEFESRVDYEAFELSDDDPSVVALEDAIRTIGREPFRKLAGGGLDANWLNQHGIPAVTVGCGQMNIHTIDEQLDVREYQDACRVATMLLCRVHPK